MKAYVNERQLDEYFIFTGFLKNIDQVLPSLDIFLMSSKTEGLGTSVIDAQAAKVPVVATAAGGIPELIRHEETGLLAEVGDHQSSRQPPCAVATTSGSARPDCDKCLRCMRWDSNQQMARSYQKLYTEILQEG